jgi:hypothetical protein
MKKDQGTYQHNVHTFIAHKSLKQHLNLLSALIEATQLTYRVITHSRQHRQLWGGGGRKLSDILQNHVVRIMLIGIIQVRTG